MRIYYSKGGSDPLIGGSVAEFRALESKLKAFVASSDNEYVVHADATGSPGNYETLLPALRLRRGTGPIMITLDPEGLRVEGASENLARWCGYFSFSADAQYGDHHHPENADAPGYIQLGSLGTIIEILDPDDSAQDAA